MTIRKPLHTEETKQKMMKKWRDELKTHKTKISDVRLRSPKRPNPDTTVHFDDENQ